MAKKAWKIIPRPLLETVLNNHVQHHRVSQPLILHGPRGVGKTTLILNRLLDDWNKGPHITGYVDFGHNLCSNQSSPWSSWSNVSPPTLPSLRSQLERCLESMVQRGIRLGTIGSQQIFSTLNKWHSLNSTLRRILQNHTHSSTAIEDKVSTSVLWSRALFALSARSKPDEINEVIGLDEKGKALTLEETSYFREALLSLRLAKEIIQTHQSWRGNAISHLNRTGGFSRSLANSSTDWPYLLLELLSTAAEVDHFQPKLVINNIDVLRNAVLTDDSTVSASMYHDSLLWRLIALGVNERCLPVVLLTSDSYYSYQAFMDFGYPDIFISRETFGWTSQEAKMHMVTDFFTESEWRLISEVLGPNPRHLSELYALKQSSYNKKVMEDSDRSTFEDILDAYLAYLQVLLLINSLRFDANKHVEVQPNNSSHLVDLGWSPALSTERVAVVNPAMESALCSLQKFAVDAYNGRISKDRLRFGAPWRHPPRTANPALCLEWAKIQLTDFIQSLVNTEFGVNYLADCSLEILDDPSTVAMLEVGLLYAQRDPSFIRPISRGIQRCLVRWLVQERMNMSFQKSLKYMSQRIVRGRSYRHLMKEAGYK